MISKEEFRELDKIAYDIYLRDRMNSIFEEIRQKNINLIYGGFTISW